MRQDRPGKEEHPCKSETKITFQAVQRRARVPRLRGRQRPSGRYLRPELEMVEPMLDFVFEHGLKPAYIVDTPRSRPHLGRQGAQGKTTARSSCTRTPSELRGHKGRGWRPLPIGDLSIKFVHTPGHAKDLVSVMRRPHPHRRRPPDRVLRTHRPPKRQRRPPVPQPVLHLPFPPRRPTRLPRA